METLKMFFNWIGRKFLIITILSFIWSGVFGVLWEGYEQSWVFYPFISGVLVWLLCFIVMIGFAIKGTISDIKNKNKR